MIALVGLCVGVAAFYIGIFGWAVHDVAKYEHVNPLVPIGWAALIVFVIFLFASASANAQGLSDKDAAALRYPMPAGEPSYWVEIERDAYIAGREDERAAADKHRCEDNDR